MIEIQGVPQSVSVRVGSKGITALYDIPTDEIYPLGPLLCKILNEAYQAGQRQVRESIKKDLDL